MEEENKTPYLWESVIIDKYFKEGDEVVFLDEICVIRRVYGDKMRRFELWTYPGMTISYDMLRLTEDDRQNEELQLKAKQFMTEYLF